ncbi:MULTISPECIES: LysR substrate-binding domain-containing protein [Buttiauxella]|uniref:LysR family transcriptional regulator n=1 Tax=Buttiauxella ferragutiae ATCC 51602 TaxID=1354252 RepID=A0ABX2W596_9ENTR|nr:MULTISPECIES: LysR substrate-binding domain-containing protein [Buttiauxella]AYN26035.1 LysR family transcriptional regulator [Buttiauxella sp. 3AFRM03]OAT25962.1 LysR family transcriptional regulator [Buttiauxella ferragutiae ATCC 51602]TDN54274.1 LysR family transcriptional regulator [Buttiauxella sp. JUb87]
MDLRHLKYFLAVAEERHFGRAAERLNIVQPALSMQIKSLETELGGPLFIRTSRRVELTEAGKLLQAEAARTLEQMEHTRLAVERSIRGETGRVRIGFAGNAVFSGRLMQDVRSFHKAYPDAELICQELAPQLQREAIHNGTLDVGYMPDYYPDHDSAFVYQSVGQWGRVVVMSSDHKLAAKESLTIDMLAHEPLIMYSINDVDSHLDRQLQRLLGDSLNIAWRISSSLSVLAMAGAGLGIALVPAPLAQVAIPGVVYRLLDAPDLSANLMMVSRKHEPSAAVLAYLNHTRITALA